MRGECGAAKLLTLGISMPLHFDNELGNGVMQMGVARCTLMNMLMKRRSLRTVYREIEEQNDD